MALTVAAAPGVAQDPDAPSGASPRWLPCERWAMMHWLPFDERRFYSLLGITREQADRWIADDAHHTFAQLARRRGLRPARLARRLVDPWTGRRPAAERARLRERARRLLTNGHLSQHVLFHVFHHPDLGAHAERLYGVSPMHYLDLRRAGYAPAEIATVAGRSRARAARRIAAEWQRGGRLGERLGETPAGQGRSFARHQRNRLEEYLDSRLEPRRPGPPPADPGIATPRPHLRLLCTIFAGSRRANDPVNYGDDRLPPGRHPLAARAYEAGSRPTSAPLGALKRTSLCVPSQNGRSRDFPHRHSATVSRPGSIGSPSWSRIWKSPRTSRGPSR